LVHRAVATAVIIIFLNMGPSRREGFPASG